jgi:hypothetical protein
MISLNLPFLCFPRENLTEPATTTPIRKSLNYYSLGKLIKFSILSLLMGKTGATLTSNVEYLERKSETGGKDVRKILIDKSYSDKSASLIR